MIMVRMNVMTMFMIRATTIVRTLALRVGMRAGFRLE